MRNNLSRDASWVPFHNVTITICRFTYTGCKVAILLCAQFIYEEEAIGTIFKTRKGIGYVIYLFIIWGWDGKIKST